MQNLELRFIQTGDFAAGEALTKYCNLIRANLNSTAESNTVTQKHHIMPRAWYKVHNKKVDNTASNLVRLSIADHAKAHLFLFQAATNPEVRAQNAAAVRYMCDLFDETLIDEAAEVLNQINLEVIKIKSKNLAVRRAAGLNERRRAVVCVETGQVFATIKAAQDSMGLFIKQHLRGLAENAGGYHFKYVQGETPQYKSKIARFTSNELLILKEQFPIKGSNIPELLERHTAETIRCKACELNISKNVV